MLDGICVQRYENSQREIYGTEKPKRHTQAQKVEEKDIHQIPSEELITHISSTGFDPQFGARPIKRMIQKELMNELSKQIIAGTIETGVPMVMDTFDGKIPANAGQAVFRKPIDEKERNGNGKGHKAREESN